jgi:hypothetical protein
MTLMSPRYTVGVERIHSQELDSRCLSVHLYENDLQRNLTGKDSALDRIGMKLLEIRIL